jgi:hypothetical protein
MQRRFPGRALDKAVKGMLPKGPLGYAMIKKLKVYAEGSHPHAAQQPKAAALKVDFRTSFPRKREPMLSEYTRDTLGPLIFSMGARFRGNDGVTGKI